MNSNNQKFGVEVTDTDIELMRASPPNYKADLLSASETESLAPMKIRLVMAVGQDPQKETSLFAPEDLHKIPEALKMKLLKRDPQNALVALNYLLQKFDTSNHTFPDFNSLPDRDLYVKRLQAILDVIDQNKDIRDHIENAAKGISPRWIQALRTCVATEEFDEDDLHMICKLVGRFRIASPKSSLEFERAYLSRRLKEVVDQD